MNDLQLFKGVRVSLHGRYGLTIPGNILFGLAYKGQYEALLRYHTMVEGYLDSHPEQHKDLLDGHGNAKYYSVLKLAMRPDERVEFMKPKPWDL